MIWISIHFKIALSSIQAYLCSSETPTSPHSLNRTYLCRRNLKIKKQLIVDPPNSCNQILETLLLELISMLIKMLLLFFIFSLISAKTLYQNNANIKELTVQTFGQVKTGVWLVQFYAHWCPHCQHFVPVYKNIAQQLKGIVNIGAVNAVEQRTEIPVTTVPTLKLFINGRKIDYKGAKTEKAVVAFVKAQLKANP